MKKLMLIGALGFLLLVSPAFALNVSLSLDKTRVLMGDTITLSGTIMSDNGTTTSYTYRAAVVAPKGIIVCDSNKTSTGTDGKFILTCKLPTAQDAATLGIPASDSRSVIPYRAGVAVLDPSFSQVVKKSKEVIAVNPDKLAKELDVLIAQLTRFFNNSKSFIPECDKLSERAIKVNRTDLVTKCVQVQQKLNDTLANITSIVNQAQQLKSNINATSIEDFREELKSIKDAQKDLRDELKDLRESVNMVRWDTLKEVNKARSEIEKEIQQKRSEIKQKGQEIKELVNKSRELRR